MRQIAMLVAVTCAAVACATSAPEHPPDDSGPDASGQQLTAVVSQGLSAQTDLREIGLHSNEPPDRSRTPSKISQPADTIEAAATQAISQLLEDEGLFVLDIATVAGPTEGPHTSVRTTVLFGTGRSHPREASYLLEVESTAGIWMVVSIEPAS